MPSPKNEVRKEIADLINRIKEQSDRIGNQREIPQSELDLILHRIEELHRKTVVWSYLNEFPEMDSQFPLESSETPVQAQEQISEEKIFKNDVQAEKFEAPTNPEPVVANEGTVESEFDSALSNFGSAQSDKTESTTSNFGSASTSLSTDAQSDKTDKPEQKQLKDVRSFVGFNEKIMYIRQVFGGNNSAYEDALNRINTMNSRDEAEAYLSVLSEEYKWKKDSEPVAIFTQTVKRRFS